MATHSSILAWKIPWAEKPGGLQSMGHEESGRARQLSRRDFLDCRWSDKIHPIYTECLIRRQSGNRLKWSHVLQVLIYIKYQVCFILSLRKLLIWFVGAQFRQNLHITSDTTSWDMSLWMAAKHSCVIFGSLVPQPIRKGWTTSELFSFNALFRTHIK